MTEERLKILLYNAMVLLEEINMDDIDIAEEIGITQNEYKEIMP